MNETRVCNTCHSDLPSEQFRPGYRRCRPCQNLIQRKIRAGIPYENARPQLPGGHRRCTACKQAKPVSGFSTNGVSRAGNTSWQTKCKECDNTRSLEWYATRRRQYRSRVDVAKDVPCGDCHQRFPPYVMDFDHVRGKKVANISAMGTWRTSVLLAEIAKCDVVCANCHRIRTWGEVRPLEGIQ